MKKIIKIFEVLKKHIAYDMCYDRHEGHGAIFGMCNKCDDKNCPYYTET